MLISSFTFYGTFIILVATCLTTVFKFQLISVVKKAGVMPLDPVYSVPSMMQKMLDFYQTQGVYIRNDSRGLNAFSPDEKALCFSDEILCTSSVAVLASALHETGHAVQFVKGRGLYLICHRISRFLRMLTLLAIPGIVVGLLLHSMHLVDSCIGAYVLAVLFGIPRVAVDLDASRKVTNFLLQERILSFQQQRMIEQVLSKLNLSYFEFIFLPFTGLSLWLLNTLVGFFTRFSRKPADKSVKSSTVKKRR